MIDSVLLSTVRVCTFVEGRLLSNASGFFFAREHRLFLVTSRHVVLDEDSGHHPDRLEIELHCNARNMAESAMFSIRFFSPMHARIVVPVAHPS